MLLHVATLERMNTKQLETVGLRELSNSLSSFVRKASLGVRVLITDRGRVIAEIRKSGDDVQQDGSPLLAEWEHQGLLRRGTRVPKKFPRGAALAPGRSINALLDELRGER